MTNNKKSQRTLLVLFAIFVVPLLAAAIMFTMRGQWSLTKPISHGHLIHPAQPVHQFEFLSLENIAHTKEFLQDKWTFVLYVPTSCNLECEAALFKLRQSIRATGKDVNRLQYLLLSESSTAPEVSKEVQQRHPKLLIGQLINWQTDIEKQESLETGFVYLIDPLGNLMMRYDSSATSKGLLKDLKKLLRVSKIG